MAEVAYQEEDKPVQETVPIPTWKLTCIEADIAELHDSRYQLKVNRSASTITITGNKIGVAVGKAKVFRALDSVLPFQHDGISRKLASILSSPSGEAKLASLGFKGSLMIEHQKVFLVACAADVETHRQRLASIVQESILKIEVNAAFLQTTEWQAFLDKVENDCLVEIDVSLVNKEVYIRGLDPEPAKKKIETFLRDQKEVKDFIAPSRPGELRFFEKYEQALPKKLDASAQIIEVDEGVLLEVSRPSGDVTSAREKLLKRIESVSYTCFEIGKPGIGAVFGSPAGKALIKGLEQMNSSVIEEEYEQVDDSSSGEDSTDEEDMFSMDRASTPDQPAAASASLTLESEAEEGHLLWEQANVSLRLYKGDITKYKADVLVNTHLSFAGGGGVTKSFILAGGKEFEQIYRSQSKGNFFTTPTSGRLAVVCKQVYHISLGRWSGDTQKILQERLDSCLRQCAADGYSSIAFPAIGSGQLNYPVNAVAECFKTAVAKHAKAKNTTRVAIVAYESGSFFDFRGAFGGAGAFAGENVEVDIGDLILKLAVIDTLVDNPIERFVFKTAIKHEFVQTLQSQEKPEGLCLHSSQANALYLHRGEITDHRADVLVNTIPLGYTGFVGAVAKAFSRAGGKDLDRDYMAKEGKGLVVTNAHGDLKKVCRRVYHVRLPEWRSGMENEIQSRIAECFQKCLSDGISSIAFPTVGCGRLGFPEEVVAKCFQAELDKLKTGKLKIDIVAYDSNLYNAFASFFKGDAMKINIGAWVRIKPGITRPRFGWGALNVKSVGQVVAMGGQKASSRICVNFKVDNDWIGIVGEMEVVEQANGASSELEIGDKVQIRSEVGTPRYKWGSISHTSVGKIVSIDQDKEGIEVNVDFPEQDGWTGLAREIRLVKSSSPQLHFSIGDSVKVKSTIESPKYGWGAVKPKSIGRVVGIEAEGKMRVTYPEKSNWLAQAEEMEQVVVHCGVQCDGCEEYPLSGPRYKCRQCDDFDFCESCFAKNKTHQHQFNKTTKPGEPAVPVRVTYSGNQEHLAQAKGKTGCGGQRTKRTPKLPNNLTFHVYATTDRDVKDTEEGIRDFVTQSLSEDVVPCSELDDEPDEVLKQLQGLSSSRVTVSVDTDDCEVRVSGTSGDVVRTRKEVERILFGNLDDLTPEKRSLTELSRNQPTVPKYWSRPSRKSTLKKRKADEMLFDVDAGTAATVKAIVDKTWNAAVVGLGVHARGFKHKHITVTGVQRIENPDTWAEYQGHRVRYAKKAMTSPYPDIGQDKEDVITRSLGFDHLVEKQINEVFLFHGSVPQNKDAIIMHGLDDRLSFHGGLFGTGVYFAESSTKADQFTDDQSKRTDGVHYMFLARVLLGNPYACTKARGFKRPPCAAANCEKAVCREHANQFDSVIGTHKENEVKLLFREFIVYNKGHCYPEFLITYVRDQPEPQRKAPEQKTQVRNPPKPQSKTTQPEKSPDKCRIS